MAKPRLIVGVDPGTTLGLAALDFNGQLILLTSGKNFSKSKILGTLLRIGNTAIIASDRAVPPHLVSELASSLGATVYLPTHDVGPKEKWRFVEEASKKLGARVLDEHQSAALFAALKAYEHFRTLFMKVDENLSLELKRKSSQLADEAKALVIKGIPPSRSVKTILLGVEPLKSNQDTLKALKKETDYYKESLSSLRAELAETKAEIRRLRSSYPARKENHRVATLELQETREKLRWALHEIEELKRQLEPFKSEEGDRIRLYLLGSISISSIKSAIGEGTLVPGRPIYAFRVLGDAGSCASSLASAGIDTVVIEIFDDMLKRIFLENGVSIISASDLAIEWKHGVPWIRRTDLLRAMKKSGADLDALKRQRIRNIIDSYREKRIRGQ
ncbi:MAG: DUF460 domain-containing protein [Thermoproteota archaeon]